MAEPSRTEWPGWEVRPVMCFYCLTRVTLKQAFSTSYDPATRKGRIWHNGCWPVVVEVSVRVPSAGAARAGCDPLSPEDEPDAVPKTVGASPPPAQETASPHEAVSLARISDAFSRVALP